MGFPHSLTTQLINESEYWNIIAPPQNLRYVKIFTLSSIHLQSIGIVWTKKTKIFSKTENRKPYIKQNCCKTNYYLTDLAYTVPNSLILWSHSIYRKLLPFIRLLFINKKWFHFFFSYLKKHQSHTFVEWLATSSDSSFVSFYILELVQIYYTISVTWLVSGSKLSK